MMPSATNIPDHLHIDEFTCGVQVDGKICSLKDMGNEDLIKTILPSPCLLHEGERN